MAGALLAKKKQTNEENVNPWLRFLARLCSAHCSQITTLTKLPKFTNAQTIIFSQLDFYRIKCFFPFSLTPTNRQTKNRHSIKNNTTATSTATTRFSGDLANSANLAQGNERKGGKVHTAEDGQTSKQAIILAAEKFKVFAGRRSQILFNDSKAPQACTKIDRARPHTLPRWRLDLEGFKALR